MASGRKFRLVRPVRPQPMHPRRDAESADSGLHDRIGELRPRCEPDQRADVRREEIKAHETVHAGLESVLRSKERAEEVQIRPVHGRPVRGVEHGGKVELGRRQQQVQHVERQSPVHLRDLQDGQVHRIEAGCTA